MSIPYTLPWHKRYPSAQVQPSQVHSKLVKILEAGYLREQAYLPSKCKGIKRLAVTDKRVHDPYCPLL